MEPNIKNIEALINQHFKGNKAAFAKALGVERSQISTLLNHGKSVGAKFFGGLIVYCETTGLDFKDYIFLPENVNNLDTTSA